MSLSTITTIVCDGCGVKIVGCEVRTAFIIHTLEDALHQAKTADWTKEGGSILKPRTDLCPACQKKGKERE